MSPEGYFTRDTPAIKITYLNFIQISQEKLVQFSTFEKNKNIYLCSIWWWPMASSRAHRQIFWHDDVIRWKHFPRYWSFVRGINRFSVNSPHKGQWRGALVFSLICDWINGWVNNREAGDLIRHRFYIDVTVMNGKQYTRSGGYFRWKFSLKWRYHFW